MKKLLFLAILVICSTATCWADTIDFSAVAPSGQTLYYKISGNRAFVTYPNHQNTSGWSGFEKPTGSLIIPQTVTNEGHTYSVTRIKDRAFGNCHGLTSVTIPNTVTRIDEYAFSCCTSLADIDMGDSVTYLGYGAFSGCTSLTSAVIPNSVDSMDCNIFYGCTSLTSVTIGNSVPDLYSTFEGCTSLTSVDMPSSVTFIGIYSFRKCYSLPQITIPNSVTGIGQCAFESCTSLQKIFIPNSVTGIENGAFHACSQVKKVIIGSSVQWMGGDVFAGIGTALDTVRVKAEIPPTICASTFSVNSYGNVVLVVPCGSLEAYRNAEYWSEFSNMIEDCDMESIAEEANAAAFTIYPNPTDDYAVISCEGLDEDVQVTLYDQQGRKLSAYRMLAGDEQMRIDMSRLSSSLYIVKLLGNHTHASQTIIKR